MRNDVVNNPKHYQREPDAFTAAVRGALIEDVDGINIECIQAMFSMFSVEELRGYLRGNSFKYRWRYREKAGVQDLEKAAWYEKRLLLLEKAIIDYYGTPLENSMGEGQVNG